MCTKCKNSIYTGEYVNIHCTQLSQLCSVHLLSTELTVSTHYTHFTIVLQPDQPSHVLLCYKHFLRKHEALFTLPHPSLHTNTHYYTHYIPTLLHTFLHTFIHSNTYTLHVNTHSYTLHSYIPTLHSVAAVCVIQACSQIDLPIPQGSQHTNHSTNSPL